LEAVPDPRFGKNVFGLRRVLLDFLPQLIDHHAQILRLLPILRPPDNLQKAAVRDRLAKVGDQMAQNLKLFRSQVHFFPVNGHTSRFEVHGQFLGDKRWKRIGGRMPAKGCANAREKLLDTERLRDVIVSTGIQRDYLVSLGAAHGEHDDRSIGGTADFAAGFDTAHARQVDIQED
jgi:hypothetical protein